MSRLEPVLLERDGELERIEAALAGIGEGGGLLLVEGPGGIGKSRLLAELSARARATGARVATARCSELEQPYAFGAVRQLLEPLVAGAAFAGAAAHARPLFDGSPALDDAPDALFARLHGLFWLCVELAADRPLVLVVDDLQWADAGSLAFAAFLRTRLPDVPVLLAVGTRPVTAPPPPLAELLAAREAVVVRPRPLSVEAVSSWAQAQLGDVPAAAFVDRCHEATGGNPLLLGELLREAADEALSPDEAGARRLGELSLRGVASVVLLRLARLPEAAQALARAVAVLGDDAELGTVAALAGLPLDGARAAAEELVRTELLRDAEPLAYTHPIVRAAVLDDIPAVTRSVRHREAAGLLRAAGAPDERVAAQVLAAGGAATEEELPVLRSAARRAMALGDPGAAVELLRAVVPATTGEERAEALLALAEAEALGGEEAAVEHLQEAVRLTRIPERRAQAAVALGRVLNFAGEPDRAIDELEAAEHDLPADSDAAATVRAELYAAPHITRSAARRLSDRLDRLVSSPDQDQTGMGLAARAFDQAVNPGGSAVAAARFARAALASGEGVTDPALGGQVTVVAGLVLTLSGHHREAETLFANGLEEARSNGSAMATAAFSAMRSLPQLTLGGLAMAEASAREALDLGRVVPTSGTLNHCALGVALIAALERGADERELDALSAHPGLAFDLDVLPSSLVLRARAHVALAHGRPAAALEGFLACDLPDRNWGRDSPALVPWRSGAALALSALGEAAEAERLAREEVGLAEAFGTPHPLGAALRVLALVGPAAEREARLRAAVAHLDGADVPLELARARADLGAELRRRNERAAARELLTRALEEAVACGAGRLSALVRDELAALGVRPPRVVAAGRALTPAERRVAELAAEGHSNREIAQRLFVTEKTVETHLSASYRKLGVRTRRDLPGALAVT